jgi:hypothetical protein
MTGLSARQCVGMMMEDAYFFSTCHEHKDLKAGDWPAKTLSSLAIVAASCTEFRARNRSTITRHH